MNMADRIIQVCTVAQETSISQVQTQLPPADYVSELQKHILSLGCEIKELDRRANAIQSRAEAVVATNAPSQAHKDYAQKLFQESTELRKEAAELTLKLNITKMQLEDELQKQADSLSGNEAAAQTQQLSTTKQLLADELQKQVDSLSEAIEDKLDRADQLQLLADAEQSRSDASPSHRHYVLTQDILSLRQDADRLMLERDAVKKQIADLINSQDMQSGAARSE